MAASLKELKEKGGDKLGYSTWSDLKVVIESDGTEVEDDNYLHVVERDTVLQLLCPEETWLPPGVEALRAAIAAIPRIVYNAINSMELVDKEPSWKIMDNRGRVTVVLHWDQKDIQKSSEPEPTIITSDSSWKVEVVSKDSQNEANVRERSEARKFSKVSFDGIASRPTIVINENQPGDEEQSESPNQNDHLDCDFHCSGLHDGAKIQINRSAATSPIPEGTEVPRKECIAIQKRDFSKNQVTLINIPKENKEEGNENSNVEDEQLSERYLLLVDQLSLERNRHLNLVDIGIILDQLSSKIIDVDHLEREQESSDVHNWTIKATIRGDVLQEIGVVYNGQYYGIMEHPGYF
ncbi:uncharacterized protein LOC111628848 [Centruroides sculpturatus]|uniref:uncharacterized protein LOC111628848 n=2 Tax=Centruroides sculpturatus TaxID=218467 RepID=UPI000C6E8C7F|nr:uncharacterized protein LOC111628848 [Centruroides sculpturatus]